MGSEPYRHAKSKRKAFDGNVIEAKEGDRIWVYGEFRLVTKVKRVNDHPVQLRRLWIEGMRQTLMIPEGWFIIFDAGEE